MWVSFHDRLLKVDYLAEKGIHISSTCSLCGVNTKTATHIFLHCSFTLELWAPKRTCFPSSSWPFSFTTLWSYWRPSNVSLIESNRWDCVVIATIWVVRNEQNQQVFKAKSSSILELGGQISSANRKCQIALNICIET